ncbi:MAG TPA: transcription antitermination factor NusB [candidate division Zixibacteria bacterium]|nr:transcription antitermination factor NusB [candidate division Zixibacteria bacterium]
MGARREARVAVLKALYAREMGGVREIDELAAQIEEIHEIPEKSALFFRALLENTIENLESIDKEIEERAQNWAFDRIAVIDRNILRLGLAELLYFEDIPPRTTINECIELAKSFGTQESARFVNGLLDGILRHLDIKKAKELDDR